MAATRRVLATLVLLPCAASAQQPKQAAPCVIKSEFEALLKKGVIPPPRPSPDRPINKFGQTLTKLEAQGELAAAVRARDIAAARLKADEAALAKANQDLVDFGNKTRSELSRLHFDVLEVRKNIREARAATSKASPAGQQTIAEFKTREIDPLVTAITSQMPNVPFEQARVSVGDFKDFDNAEIRQIKAAIKAAETSIANTNAKYEGRSEATLNTDDAGRVDKQNEIIKQQTTLLATAIERARASARQDIRAYDKKQEEYDAKVRQLFPDDDTRKLVENLGVLEAELAAKEQQIASINAENRKLVEARRKVVDRMEVHQNSDGSATDGSREILRHSENLVQDSQALLAAAKDYEEWLADDNFRTALIANKTAYDNVVIAKNSELAEAQQVVTNVKGKLSNERARVRAAELPKFTQTAEYRAAKRQLSQRITGMDPSRKAAEIKTFKQEQSARLNAIVSSLVQPMKDSENRHLTELLTKLAQYNCWDDVAQSIAEVQKQMAQSASLVRGADFDFMDTSGWEQMPYDDVADADTRWVGTWKCTCKIALQFNADHTGSWIDSRGGPAGSMYESGTFTGTWSGDAASVTLTTSVAKYGRRGGSVTFTLRDGELHDAWGDVYVR